MSEVGPTRVSHLAEEFALELLMKQEAPPLLDVGSLRLRGNLVLRLTDDDREREGERARERVDRARESDGARQRERDPLGPLGFNFSQHGPSTRPSRKKDCRESFREREGCVVRSPLSLSREREGCFRERERAAWCASTGAHAKGRTRVGPTSLIRKTKGTRGCRMGNKRM